MPKVLLSLNFCTNKGFEQAEKKQSGGLFFRRGNEQSEAIGAGAPRQNPFQRAKIDKFRLSLFYLSEILDKFRKGDLLRKALIINIIYGII